jgi:glycosyltransferase involved in cell wall biosynthesis
MQNATSLVVENPLPSALGANSTGLDAGPLGRIATPDSRGLVDDVAYILGDEILDQIDAYRLPADFLLSVVIPVYNEHATVLEIVRRVLAVDLPIEVLVVDDCSTDGTRMLLEKLDSRPQVRIFYHDRNQGKGAAVRTGIAQASGSVVLIQDADLEYDPGEYSRLIRPLVSGEADVVYGSRYLAGAPAGQLWRHRVANRLLTWLSNRLTRLKLTDMETCYKIFRREALAGIEIQQNRFGLEPELTAKIARRGCRVVELPIDYHCRRASEGKKIGWRDAVNALYCIVRYSWAD